VSIDIKNNKALIAENAELRSRLDEAEETLGAIRSGEVDALVIGDQVYTLESSDAASNRFRGEVLAQINEAVVAIDNEQRLTYINPAAERQYDAKASEVLGRHLNSLYEYRWTKDGEEEEAWEQMEKKGYWRGENVHVKSNGDEVYVESSVNVLRNRDGERVGLLAVIRDVSERKATEMALTRKEQELRDFVENAAVGMHWVGPDGIIVWANRAELQMLGYEQKDYVGQPFAMFHAERDIGDKLLQRLKDGEVFENHAASLVCRDGSIRHVLISSDVLWENGEFIHTRCFTRDVTEQKMAEAALRSSEERLKKALSIETVGVLYLDMNTGLFTGANDAFASMSGQSVADMSSRKIHWRDLTPPEFVEHTQQALDELRATGRSAQYEKECLRKDGTRFWGLFTASLLSANEAVEFVLDVTSRKRAEEALLDAHDKLEFRVAERTLQLAQTNQALQIEMDEHRIAQRQKGELLQKIVTTQEDERRRIARDIHDQLGQRVTALRLQLASLSNALDVHPDLSSRITPLQQVAERLDAEVSFLAWELRPAALDDLGLPEATDAFLDEWSRHYSIPADLHLTGFSERRLGPEVETHLYRIMQESLNNIAKHALATHVNVLLKRNKKNVTLIVEDNGRGFNPSKKTPNGSSAIGLGLLGMNERAMLLHGDLQIESSPGTGTTIYVRIPTSSAF
jgi:PAS domain S-box-containing protein